MIEYIQGKIDSADPQQVVIDVGGIGYRLCISQSTYAAISGKEQVRLYAHEVIREDAHTLYGFASRRERDLFLLLIGVSGIGGGTARLVLSALTPDELIRIIRREDAALLKRVKGIGPKAAARIIVDLKDKILLLETSSEPLDAASTNAGSTDADGADEAMAALTMLGFPPAACQKAVRHILTEQPTLPVEQIIKLALKML